MSKSRCHYVLNTEEENRRILSFYAAGIHRRFLTEYVNIALFYVLMCVFVCFLLLLLFLLVYTALIIYELSL